MPHADRVMDWMFVVILVTAVFVAETKLFGISLRDADKKSSEE
jgi:hypothetical protein